MHICKKQNFQTTNYLQSDDLVPLTFASFAWKKQQIVGKKKFFKTARNDQPTMRMILFHDFCILQLGLMQVSFGSWILIMKLH